MPGIGIGNNTLALQTQRLLGKHSEDVSASYERLSSGMRINSASDDAAGLAVSSELNLDTRVFNQAVRNANDVISAVSIAEGALGELSLILDRLKELATQASNGILGYDQRSSLNAEAFALTNEYNRISEGTKFNGISILDGSLESLGAQLGYGDESVITFSSTEELERIVGTFSFEREIPNTPVEGHLVDIDGDGDLDLVEDSGTIVVYHNDGEGGFSLASTIYEGTDVGEVGFGDFDGDGLLDIVIGREDAAGGGLYISKQAGDGTFAFTKTTGSIGIDELVVTDFDNDGNLDVVGVNNDKLVFYRGLGTASPSTEGNFVASFTFDLGTTNYTWEELVVGDFDGDGNMDVAGNATARGVFAFLNDGSGNFSLGLSATGGIGSEQYLDEQYLDIGIGDFDSDGRLDIVTGLTGSDSGSTPGGLALFFGNGDGTFQDQQILNLRGDQVDFVFYDLKVDDFDNDGNLDIMTLEVNPDTFNTETLIYDNDGTGNFSLVTVSDSIISSRMTVGDINGDGVTDFITGNNHRYYGVTTTSTSMQRLNLGSKENALAALDEIESQAERVSKQLGILGSIASRLETALSHLQRTSENYATAASRITDIDVASEAANLVRAQILQSAASAVGAQANLQPGLAVLLLTPPEQNTNSP